MRQSVRGLLTAVLLAAASVSVAHAQEAKETKEENGQRSVTEGVFTEAQAQRGQTAFSENCSSCHSPSEFSHANFLRMYAGTTVHEMFEGIRTTMPEDAPGSLSRQEYADVLAYIYSLQRLPTGEAELPAEDEAALRAIIVRLNQ